MNARAILELHASALDLRLIELGDGQVSDRKQRSAARFVSMLRES
ncbi:MAG TPA: hypothetical protein VK843_03180 [Planctomycetota bacterium]|nr:hypothetical protein [Planctomycetota bacterium]